MILRNRIFIINVKVKSVANTDAELLGEGEERRDERQWSGAGMRKTLDDTRKVQHSFLNN